jgi:adenylosuccinate lyase
MAAVRHGVGREAAHEAIKEHAVGVALAMRQGQKENDLLDRLAADPRLGVSREVLADAVANPLDLTGSAAAQVHAVVERVRELAVKHPEGASYAPGAVL